MKNGLKFRPYDINGLFHHTFMQVDNVLFKPFSINDLKFRSYLENGINFRPYEMINGLKFRWQSYFIILSFKLTKNDEIDEIHQMLMTKDILRTRDTRGQKSNNPLRMFIVIQNCI